MNILVFIKQVEDIRVPVACDAATGTVKAEWNVPVLNPDDGAAIEAALELKAGLPESRITLINLGPPCSEGMIRDGLALGCDEGLRVWDNDLEDLHAPAKAVILARVARTMPFDLILAGAGSQDTASAQLGLLLASSLGVPCITHATELRRAGVGAVAVDRRLARGFRQEVRAATPLVVTMVTSFNEGPGRYASLPALLEETTREIPCVDLADIGIPAQWVRQTESLLSFGPLGFPKARRKFIAAPDSSLPAYERREKLREGSIKRREGRIVKGGEDAVVEELFQALLQGGWLSHLRG
ncbi:MAG TPA: hypothetical protein VLW86_05985 [Syntrophorhabdales bacterium]|nr:hypothetical protein [Syntrophorhabdales bacterium]